MATRILPVFLTGFAAAAMLVAPAAGASSVSCENSGPASVCSRPGHNAIYATPPQETGRQFSVVPGGGPIGTTLSPPLLVMD